MRRIKFYREGNRWFAHLPWLKVSKEECEMIDGADDMLDVFSSGDDEVTLSISEERTDFFDIALEKIKEDSAGATYRALEASTSALLAWSQSVWLCSVTTLLFGRYPQTLFINKTYLQ